MTVPAIPWTAVVPVKPWHLAKSRLGLSAAMSYAVARAMTLDTLELLAASRLIGRVVLVSADVEARSAAGGMGAVCVTDRPLVSADPLNEAVRSGAAWASLHLAGRPVVVVPADLCFLTPGTLDGTLSLLGQHPSAFVADVRGGDTTLLAARDPREVAPFYGRASAQLHRAAGVHDETEASPTARHDVNTIDDLRAVQVVGAARNLRAALDASRHDAGARELVESRR